jgi:hypothetical protein
MAANCFCSSFPRKRESIAFLREEGQPKARSLDSRQKHARMTSKGLAGMTNEELRGMTSRTPMTQRNNLARHCQPTRGWLTYFRTDCTVQP